MEKISVVMVGVGGHSRFYLHQLFHTARGERFSVVGAVDPYAKKSPFFQELCDRRIPIYSTLDGFYGHQAAELAIIVTPIHLHAEMAVCCMEHGSHVLCEKPICASPEEALAMIEARNRTGQKLAIGFQWSFSDGILQLKRDLIEGRYGAVRRVRTIVYFPRDLAYFRRGTGWAGKRRSASGGWILDSVASNAAAHYLHNMLFLSGERIDRSAWPAAMTAEVYRANEIEMFDTCALRVHTARGAELDFYATQAVPMSRERQPEFVLEAERGTVTLRQTAGGDVLTGTPADGETVLYSAPEKDRFRKLDYIADAVCGDTPLPCVPETTLPHLACIWSLARSFPETPAFPEEYIRHDKENDQYFCHGLDEALEACYQAGKLPYEKGIPWAREPHEIRFGHLSQLEKAALA